VRNCTISTTWAVSDLWPGKIHLHAWTSATLIPFEIVSLWLNTLLPAVPPLFEAFLESLFANGIQLGRRLVTQIESLSAAFSGGGTANNRKEPCREIREPVEPQECYVWPRKFESVARNGLVRCHDAAATFPLPIGTVSWAAQHHEGDEGLPGSILC